MSKNIKKGLQGTLFCLIIIAFIIIGNMDFTPKVKIDNERFDEDYPNVDKNNVFSYVTGSEVYSILKNGSAIIFMGFPSNAWSGYYAKILNDTAKQSGIDSILYYDFYDDRTNKNATYQSIVVKLSRYLPMLDEGRQNIYAPTLLLVKNGEVVAYDNETAINTGNISPEEYWSNLKVGLKMSNLKMMFSSYLTN